MCRESEEPKRSDGSPGDLTTSAYEASEYITLRWSLLEAYPLTGAVIGKCTRKGPSLRSKCSRLFGESLAGEESRETGTRCGSCAGVKGVECPRGFSSAAGLSSAVRSSFAGMFSLPEGISFVGEVASTPDPYQCRGNIVSASRRNSSYFLPFSFAGEV